MDKIVSKITALGIPGIVLLISISATGLSGAAAITTALAALGPFGMIGGIATLGVISLASQAITEYGFNIVFTAVVKELYRKGENKDSILSKIRYYPISKSLKRKLEDELNKISV